MTPKDVLEICATIIASLGGAGAIIFGLSGYLGKVWADRALASQQQQYAQLNIAFSNQLDIATRRLQVELDTLGVLHKLRTESEFDKVREMWRHIARLRGAFWSIPKAGLQFGSPDKERQHKYNVMTSEEFIKRFDEAEVFWNAESLVIPATIADSTEKVLKIAKEEVFQAFQFPDPMDRDTMIGFDSSMTANFFDQRAKNLRAFEAASQDLKKLMREYLQGTKKKESR